MGPFKFIGQSFDTIGNGMVILNEYSDMALTVAKAKNKAIYHSLRLDLMKDGLTEDEANSIIDELRAEKGLDPLPKPKKSK